MKPSLQVAKKIGSREAIKAMLIAVGIAELYSLLRQTSGDFANGILFYIDDHLRLEVILSYVVLFSTTYFFGRKAGKEIVTLNKNAPKVAIKYSILATLIIVVYVQIITFLENGNISSTLTPSLAMLCIMTMIWLWIGRQIKIKGAKSIRSESASETV